MKELFLFCRAVISGALLFFVYDIQVILQYLIPHSRIAIRIEEGLYWTGVGIFIFCEAYRLNQGIFRGFFVGGIFIGGTLYHQLVGVHLRKLIKKQRKRFFNILKKLTKPIRIFIKRLINFYNRCKIFISNIRKKRKKQKSLQEKNIGDRGNQ